MLKQEVMTRQESSPFSKIGEEEEEKEVKRVCFLLFRPYRLIRFYPLSPHPFLIAALSILRFHKNFINFIIDFETLYFIILYNINCRGKYIYSLTGK